MVSGPTEAVSTNNEQPNPTSNNVGWLQPAVVSLGVDLLLTTRIEDVIRNQGGYGLTVATADEFMAAIERYFPVLAFVDLDVAGEWQGAIMRAKVQAHTRQIPLYAFSSQVDGETLQAARQAGADQAWARSRLMAELVTVVDHHLHPPPIYPAGWDDQLTTLARQGIAEFNQGEYFEQHEQLEAAWLAETRPIRDLYQGILQVGVALLQIERQNWRGALKLFRRGLPKLRPLPDVCQGIDLKSFRTAAEAIHAEITQLGPARLHEFDRSRFPQITFADSSPISGEQIDQFVGGGSTADAHPL